MSGRNDRECRAGRAGAEHQRMKNRRNESEDRHVRKVDRGSIFHRVARQSLKRNRAGTLVTIIGVALSTALFTAIATFGTSIIGFMIDSEVAKGGNWHITFSDIPLSRMAEWEEDPEAEEGVFFENTGYAVLEGAGEQSAKKPYLFIAGFSDETFERLPVSLTCGRMPENSEEIIVPAESIAWKAGVRIGVNDTLTLLVGERQENGKVLTQCDPYRQGEALSGTKERTYTVVGTFERPGFELHAAPGYTVITRADGKAESGSLYMALKNPRSVRDYGEKRAAESSYGINENLLRFMGVSDNRVFNVFMYTIGGVLAAIIMTGSVFLIYNAFQISLNARMHQYGILMSVGATAKQLRGMVLYEGLCIGCVGIPAGMAAGIGCVSLLLPVVAENFAGIINYGERLTLSVSFPALLGSALISLVTILISAYIPARKAAASPVMDCIRQNGEVKAEAGQVEIGRTAWKLCGLEGALALKNFRRNKKRYRSIVLSLTLSVVLTVTGSAFGGALGKMGSEYTGQKSDGDVLLTTQDMAPRAFEGLCGELAGLEGIERATWQTDCFYQARTEDLPADFLLEYREAMGDESAGTVQDVTLCTQFIEDDIYEAYIEEMGLPVEEYRGTDGKVLICLMDLTEHVTYFAGDSMYFTLESAAGGAGKRICATFEDSYPLDGVFVLEDDPAYCFVVTAPLSAREQFEGQKTVDGKVHLGAFFWSKNPTEALRKIQKWLLEKEVMANYSLLNVSRAFELYRSAEFIISIFTYVFVFMISLIAIANVFNTISANIRMRRREFAMLRSVGMSDADFKRMLRFECVFYGMRTLAAGVPVAVLLSFLIHRVFMAVEQMDDVAFTFPWGALAFSVLEVFGIVFLTMAYMAGKIRRENIMDALRDEMT